MRDDPIVIELVRRAAAGQQAAWDELVERYAPLVWSICQKHRLERADIDDVGQSVWLLLVEKIDNLGNPRRCRAGWRPRPQGMPAGLAGRAAPRSMMRTCRHRAVCPPTRRRR